MNQRLAAIQARRVQLLERAAQQRMDIAQTLQSWAKPAAFVDRCVDVARMIVSRPPLLAGIAVTWTVIRPRRAFRWARRAFALWQGYRWLNRKLSI